MSAGVANVFTLYDKKGNPVEVQLQDGEYRLRTSDIRTHEKLDEIKMLLARMVELMEEGT